MKGIATSSHQRNISNKLTMLSLLLLAALTMSAQKTPPQVRHSHVGETVTAQGGVLTITCVGKKQNFDYRDAATLDADINSPKSVNFHPDGSKYYVNSLEGCATVVYDRKTGRKLKVISHRHDSGEGPLWNTPSGIYRFTHYPDGQQRSFGGKPVEATFSHGGRYLWVPYYRRTFDLNAQDPSAIAIIDTQVDSIVRMMETGPLPKMVACNHSGSRIAVTHWGNNTVGLIDITSDNPKQWHHLPYVVIGQELKLDFSLTESVDRDKHSGQLLRGTVFTPDDRYLLVGCMGGGGGIAVIDMKPQPHYVGRIGNIYNARHLIISGNCLYASINVTGVVQRVPLDSVIQAIAHRQGTNISLGHWQTARVGAGARTIEASPSGRYVFAACNLASALYVVDTEHMQTIAQIPVDSYPVGLDISQDGRFVIVTSQGRQHQGGNAVNLYRVDYADTLETQAYQAMHNAGSTTHTDSVSSPLPTITGENTRGWWQWLCDHAAVAGTLACLALLLLIGWLHLRRFKQ